MSLASSTDEKLPAVSEPGPESGEEAPPDAFAGDLFAEPPMRFEGAPGADEGRAGRPASSDHAWQRQLPRISGEAARASRALRRLDHDFTTHLIEIITRVLARHTLASPVSLSTRAVQEVEFAPQTPPPDPSHRLFTIFGLGPAEVSALLVCHVSFAAALADRVLGGEGVRPDRRRPLTIVERSAFEFICLNAAEELNRLAGEPYICLRRCGADGAHSPNLFARREEQRLRGLAVCLRVVIGEIDGYVYLFLGGAALAVLAALPRNSVAHRSPANSGSKRWLPEVRLAIMIGETDLNLGDLEQLEHDDIVMIDRGLVHWRDGITAEGVRVRAGRGLEIQGELRRDTSLRLKIAHIGPISEARGMENYTMSEESGGGTPGATDEGAALLDHLLLTVRVELGARYARLEEVAGYRAGQILELGCRATDPVDLLIEGRRLARGELIEIEGQLGVRITRITG